MTRPSNHHQRRRASLLGLATTPTQRLLVTALDPAQVTEVFIFRAGSEDKADRGQSWGTSIAPKHQSSRSQRTRARFDEQPDWIMMRLGSFWGVRQSVPLTGCWSLRPALSEYGRMSMTRGAFENSRGYGLFNVN